MDSRYLPHQDVAVTHDGALPSTARFAAPAMRTVAVLDTAAGSTNLGDSIIMEAVRQEIDELFPHSMIFTITSHERMSGRSRRLIRDSTWAISGGTTLLSSRMWFRSNWNVTPLDALAGLRVVLLGAGWYQYQHAPDPYSRWVLRRLLRRDCLHSVRDGHALRMLASIGITNAVNTGCPTLWHLTPTQCRAIPRMKADAVVTTVNSYRGLRDPAADRQLLEILTRRYRTVYLWIQTHSDHEYARSLQEGLIHINPRVAALDAVLTSELDVDYVGNRLHAGIRALQRGRRTVIVEIDNRAREMGKDFGLPTVGRTEFARLEALISQPFETVINVPHAAIDRWKSQFR